ncbi:MAG: S1/P1 nuclease [Burkholderiales bacterium]|nr:S1/P1 nuclease [Burkholderiales bacterium]
MKLTQLLLSLCCVLGALNAQALGDEGHKTVGAIADRLLVGTKAEERVKALLLPGESLESISIWADCAKGRFCGEPTSEMTAFTLQNPKHAGYHYINLPVQSSAYAAGAVGSTDHDIVRTLQQAIAVLQGNDTEATNPHRFTPRQALLMIAHLVGDIHQPLHVGAAYINSDNQFVTPSTQQQVDGISIFDLLGGNNLHIEDKATWTARDVETFNREQVQADNKSRLGKPLHLFWDVTVVEKLMRDLKLNTVTEFSSKLMTELPEKSTITGDAITWPEQWANQSLSTAKLAYADITIIDKVKMTTRKGVEYTIWYGQLPTNYVENSTAITRKQIASAGVQLAELLKKIWP